MSTQPGLRDRKCNEILLFLGFEVDWTLDYMGMSTGRSRLGLCLTWTRLDHFRSPQMPPSTDWEEAWIPVSWIFFGISQSRLMEKRANLVEISPNLVEISSIVMLLLRMDMETNFNGWMFMRMHHFVEFSLNFIWFFLMRELVIR